MPQFETTLVDLDTDEEYPVEVLTYYEPADPSVGYMTESHIIEEVKRLDTGEWVDEEIWGPQEDSIMEALEKWKENELEAAAADAYEARREGRGLPYRW